mmetsp:Transcript_112843/g.313734  ORF Transcript_112843/g.313734 Transcript_112843/m.313734 type:complete len:248 (+) Transcript_112843:290-1033(+)
MPASLATPLDIAGGPRAPNNPVAEREVPGARGRGAVATSKAQIRSRKRASSLACDSSCCNSRANARRNPATRLRLCASCTASSGPRPGLAESRRATTRRNASRKRANASVSESQGLGRSSMTGRTGGAPKWLETRATASQNVTVCKAPGRPGTAAALSTGSKAARSEPSQARIFLRYAAWNPGRGMPATVVSSSGPTVWSTHACTSQPSSHVGARATSTSSGRGANALPPTSACPPSEPPMLGERRA